MCAVKGDSLIWCLRDQRAALFLGLGFFRAALRSRHAKQGRSSSKFCERIFFRPISLVVGCVFLAEASRAVATSGTEGG